MRVKTISVEFGFTKNCGNFQSAKVSAQVWAEIGEEEDEDGAIQYLFDKVKDAVRANLPTKNADPSVTIESN
jgi:hypothetical protein